MLRLALVLCCTLAAPAAAELVSYRLDAENSLVGFEYTFGGQPNRGRMPVQSAEILLDFDRPSRSTVNASINTRRATAGVFFATEAMKGASVLDTDNHPSIEFQSTSVLGQGLTAKVDGLLTIRGVTRPVTLEAQIYRPQDSKAGERDRLTIRLSGTISRSAFGASGFPDFVGDEIGLDILARLDRVR